MFINVPFSLKFYSSQQHVILSCISPVHNLRQYGFVTSPNALLAKLTSIPAVSHFHWNNYKIEIITLEFY